MSTLVDIPLWLWAPVAGLVYGWGCIYLKGTFPFSEFDLYGCAATRDEGAVPLFTAHGEEAVISDFGRFSGLGPEHLHTRGYPCSLTWMVVEAKRWVEENQLPLGDEPGPVAVTFGFRMLRVDDQGVLTERRVVLGQGTAWPIRS